MTKPVTRKMVVDWFLDRCEVLGVAVTCGICGGLLKPGDNAQWDHIHADVFDGPHEYQNLRPVHAECHKRKTKQDVQDNAKIKRILAKQRKRDKPQKFKRKMQSRGFSKRSPDNPYRWPKRKMGR